MDFFLIIICQYCLQVVASMDWPRATKYKGLVCAQQHRQEIISDLFTETKDPQKGTVYGGMIRRVISF